MGLLDEHGGIVEVPKSRSKVVYNMEDGSYHTWEEDTPINTHMIPTESNKLWNVPPPSYIRGVSIGSGEYISFDDNTKPPSFDDGTAPPSFDATSGT